jgi:hypothetical protein
VLFAIVVLHELGHALTGTSLRTRGITPYDEAMKVRKAVFPAAGLGTRFLPATKAQPKEMLPLVDKPMIQYVVEEAVASGLSEILASGLPSLVCGGPRRRSLALTLGTLGFRVQPTRGPDGARPSRRRRAIDELHSCRDEVGLRLTVATALGLYVEWRRQH